MAEFQSFRRLCWASDITRETNDQNSAEWAPTRRRVGAHWSGPNGPAPARPWEDATRRSPLRREYWRAGSRILDRAIVHRVSLGAPGITQRRRLHGAISLMKDMRVAQALPAFHGETITPSRWGCRIRPLASYRSPC